MKRHDIVEVLGLLATAGVVAGCSKVAPTTEVPAARDEQCLHADGCCGGHAPGDATCGADEAAKAGTSPDAAAEPSAGPWTRTWTIAPGDMAEINLALEAGETMAATFSTDGGALKWNVHSHEGNEVTLHAEGQDAAGKARHVASNAGMYSFLWMNAGKTPVVLTVELESGASRVHSTHPEDRSR